MSTRPNILWIVTTQWRAQACGYAGDPNARTPHLDRLAATSIDFAQAVTPHPFGPFARAALLTGVPSPENGVRDYFDPLPPDAPTVAHRLRKADYSTAFFGKWHLARRDPAAPLVGEIHARTPVPPEARGGFEFWEGFEGGFLLNDPWLQGTRLDQPTRFEGYQSDVLCARAAEWLQSQTERPTFCVVSLEAPHPPYAAAAAGVSPRDPSALLLPANVPTGGEIEAKARHELSGYYSHIEATDRAIGRLLPADESREARRAKSDRPTIIVFTSVHGDMHGSHGLFRKGWPYEESVRVPLLVRLPQNEGLRSVAKTAQLVSLLDLPQWAEAWAGLSGPGPTAEIGRSTSGCRRPPGGPSDRQLLSMPSVVPLPHQCDREWRGLRTGQRKLVVNADDSPWLYFDLEKDPGEMTNLAEDPARAGEIRPLLEELAASESGSIP